MKAVSFFLLILVLSACGSDDDSEFSPPKAREIDSSLISTHSGFTSVNGVSFDETNIVNVDYYKQISTSVNDDFKGTWIVLYQSKVYEQDNLDPIQVTNAFQLFGNSFKDQDDAILGDVRDAVWNEEKEYYEMWKSSVVESYTDDMPYYLETYIVSIKLSDSAEPFGIIRHWEESNPENLEEYSISSVTFNPSEMMRIYAGQESEGEGHTLYYSLSFNYLFNILEAIAGDNLSSEGVTGPYYGDVSNLSLEGDPLNMTVHSEATTDDGVYYFEMEYAFPAQR